MRIPVALYPYCPELLPFVRHFEKMQDSYALKRLVSPSGFALTGKDAAYACNHSNIGVVVTDDLGLNEETWDTLLVTRSRDIELNDEEELLATTVENALCAGKTVLFFEKSLADIPSKLLEIKNLYSDKLHFHTGDMYSLKSGIPFMRYLNMNAPVILVGGLFAEADTLEVLIHFAERLRAEKLCPAVLTRHPIGNLFGFHSIGHILDDTSITEAEKIARLNYIAKDIELSEGANVLLMEAPDAVMRYNDMAPNGFGIQTYMLCNAIPPDDFICCVPFSFGVGEVLDSIDEKLSGSLGTRITAVHLSNLLIDSVGLMQSNILSYSRADLKAVCEQIANENAKSKVPLFDVVQNGIDGVFELCINEQ